MTDEMAVQGQRPSTLPYALGGAAIGGTAGYLVADKLPFKKPMYTSYEQIINEVHDAVDFSKLKEGKSEEIVKALDAAKEELGNYLKLDKLKESELLGAKANVLPEDNAVRKAYEKAVQAFKDRKPSDEEIEKVAKELNKDAKEITEEMKKAAEKVINGDKKKYFKEEYKNVIKALNELVTEAGDKKVFSGATEAKFNEIKKWSKSAEERLKPLLEKCKTGNKWLWAGIGAAVLALGALAIAPKHKDQH